LTTFEDTLSYLVGADLARMQLGSLRDILELEPFLQGVDDQLADRGLQILYEDREGIIERFEMMMMERDTDFEAENIAQGKQYIEDYKQFRDVLSTRSGLYYRVIEEGDGPKPKEDDRVLVNYRGTTVDGNEFDSSYQHGEPQILAVNGVIEGFSEALQMMNVGGKLEVVIPPELAYGRESAGPDIGPSSTLIFQIELLEIR
jgi:FKBP-type peptidyl-prolyl cis-trans isomerase FklB